MAETPEHTFTPHLGDQFPLTLNAPVVDGSALDMTANDWGGWAFEVRRAAGGAALLAVTETATANGSVITVANDGQTAALEIEEADLDAIGRGTYHYNLYYTWAGKRTTVLHGVFELEG